MTPSPVSWLMGPEEVRVVGLALLHFLWQGALLGLAVAVALRLIHRRASQLRYLVALLGLSMMVATPFGTAAWLAEGGVSSADPSGSPVPDAALVDPVELPETVHPGSGDAVAADASTHGGSADGRDHPLQPALPWLVTGWLVGVLGLVFRYLGGWIYLRRRILRRARRADETVRRRVRELQARIGMTRPLRTLILDGLSSPLVVGWVRPAVIVPASLLASLPVGEFDALLAHELAHVKRLDNAVNLLQVAAETLLFFHPAVWWVSSAIREEREHCCDEIAARACGDRKACARALARLVDAGPVESAWAATASGGSLVERIRRLSGPSRRTPAARGGIAVAGGLLTVMIAAVLAQAAVAGTGEPAAGPIPGSGRSGGAASAETSSLAGQWDRALREVSREGVTSWIGWGLADVAEGATIVSNSPGAPGRDGGPPLRSHLDADAPAPAAALLLGVRPDSRQVIWMRLRGTAVPTDLAGFPLRWLGTASTSESLGLLEQILASRPPAQVRQEISAALTLHPETDLVVPAVRRLLSTEEQAVVRAEAVAWIDRHRGDDVVALLREAATMDPSPLVREVALGSLEEFPGVLDFLDRVTFSDPDPAVRAAAFEALADSDSPAVPDALRRVADRHPDASLRERAREELQDADHSPGDLP